MVYFLSITLLVLLIILAIGFYQYQAANEKAIIAQRSYTTLVSTADNRYHEYNNHIRELSKQMEHRLLEQEGRLRAEFITKGAAIRKDAIEKSRVVNKGFDGETFAPFLQDQWLCKDFRHISDPVDYLVLDGAEMVRSGLQEEINSITILEIKTGNADMNTVQRRIRDAVVAGRTQFAVYNVETKEMRIWSPSNPRGKTNVNNNTSA